MARRSQDTTEKRNTSRQPGAGASRRTIDESSKTRAFFLLLQNLVDKGPYNLFEQQRICCFRHSIHFHTFRGKQCTSLSPENISIIPQAVWPWGNDSGLMRLSFKRVADGRDSLRLIREPEGFTSTIRDAAKSQLFS